MTLTGPHRDDVLLTLNGMPARSHSSHGESWSFALALRLGSAAELRQSGGADADPIVILDDVFAELDRGRARALAEMLADFEQVLVTTAVADDLPGELHAQPFWVAEGVVGEGFRTGEPDE
jgi:DNA replication and repair protein RecF